MIELSAESFFYLLIFGGFGSVIAVMIPVQIASKLRRLHRRRTRAICRLCGYHFLRPEQRGAVSCPHCGAKNK